jgi:hypothetical protein
MSTSVYTGLNPFNFICKHFCKSSFRKSLCTYKRCWKWCPRSSIQAWTRLILFANIFANLSSESRCALIKGVGSDVHGFYTGVNPFNFICKHFCKSSFRKSLCTYKRCWKWCLRASIQAWTRLILFANTFCISEFRKSLCTYKRCWKWCPRASIQVWNLLILFANTFCKSESRKSLCTYKRCWKWCLRASIQVWNLLILFANTFCKSEFRKSLCTYKRCWKWCLRASIQA